MRLTLMVSLVFALSIDDAAAQYRIDTWTAENGLPGNPVSHVLQTRDGFLWLTMYSGLVRFDGVDFTIFNPLNTPGLRSSRINNEFEDREGNLWLGVEGQGLARYRDGVFTPYGARDGVLDPNPRGFFYDSQGRLALDTAKGLLEWKDGRFVAYSGSVPGIADTDKKILFRMEPGATWYSDKDGVHKFENGRITRSLPADPAIKWLAEDSKGRVWMEREQDSHRVLTRLADGKLITYSERDGVGNFSTMKFFEDREGVIWFGMSGDGGLLRFKDEKFTRYSVADGLPTNNIGAISQDREGTIWVPSAGGFSRLTPQIITSYTREQGLAADTTYPIYQDHTGAIWIGSWTGIARYKDGVFTDFSKSFGLEHENVQSLLEDHSNDLWIGTWSGIKRVRNGVASAIPKPDQLGLPIRAILQDREGDIWFGGSPGLVIYKNGAFKSFTRQDGFSGNEVLALHEDRAGNLWIGTAAGLTKYHDGTFTDYGEKDGFKANLVRAIHEDGEGALWLGTYDTGLFRFKNGKFTHYTTQAGPFDNGAFQILEDNRGNFWISCNAGIYRVSRKELNDYAEGRTRMVTSVSYGKRDGMLNAETNGGGQPAGTRTTAGDLWFPTAKGVAVIHAEALPLNSPPPPVVISNFVINHQYLPFQNKIEIQPDQGEFEIHYAGLTYVRPDLTKFRYKLEGLDDDWIDASGRRVAYFNHIPFGDYTFRVTAANREGIWNAEGASVRVVVLPPFWRTAWFQGMVVVLLAAMAFAAYKVRMNSLLQAQAQREAFSRQLITTQEAERKRLARELHDSLSQSLVVIKNWALLLITAPKDETATRKLQEISSTASQALEEVREIAHNLGPYQLDSLGLTRTIEEMTGRVSSATDIRLSVNVAKLDGVLTKESEINLYRIIQESINNIVKHSSATEAAVTVSLGGPGLMMTISDNGKGFDARNKQGFGLLGLAERVQMLGGEWSIESEPGVGTHIYLQVPLKKNGHDN